jgi:hypothetical protein
MTTDAYIRRPRTRVSPVDVSHFRPVVDQAMTAFQSDVSYAVHMARAAMTIVRKREVWQARRDAQEA